MNKLKIFFLFLIFFYPINSFADKEIVFVNLDLVIQKSKAGMIIKKNLEKKQKKNTEYFQNKSKEFKKKEDDLLSKKNIIYEIEFKKEVNILKKEINEFQIERKKKINDLQQQRLKYISIFAKKINPILSEYSKNNSISMVIDKKNIVVGKSELDITNEILKIVDKKIEKIEID